MFCRPLAPVCVKHGGRCLKQASGPAADSGENTFHTQTEGGLCCGCTPLRTTQAAVHTTQRAAEAERTEVVLFQGGRAGSDPKKRKTLPAPVEDEYFGYQKDSAGESLAQQL